MRDRRLFRTGRLTQANVIFVKPDVSSSWPGWPGMTTATVFVSLKVPSGTEHEARAPCQNDWLIAQLRPGQRVHVVYSPEKPSRVALLEAYVR